MKNTLLLVLIIIASIFPFAATGFELTEDLTAMALLAAMTIVTILIAVVGMIYRPRKTAETETPVQAIPTITSANTRRNAPAANKK